MKRTPLLTALLLAVSAPTARADGVNLSWGNACWADSGHSSSLTWACDSDTYTGVRMTCSFQPLVDRTNFVAINVYMEGITADQVTLVPDWWKLGSGECRSNLVTMSIDASVLGGACVDPWQGPGGGGIGLYSWETNRTHLNASYAVRDPVAIHAADEIFGVQFRIATEKTVGPDLCAGCRTSMLWALNYIEVAYQGEMATEFLDTPLPGGNQILEWQGDDVPVRNTTWGQVKSLYR